MQETPQQAAAPYTDRYLPGNDYGAPQSDGGLIDIAWVRAFLWRQRWILASVTLLALAVGFIMTMLTTPIFQATSTVRVNMQGGQIVEGQDVVDPYIAVNEVDRYLQTLAGVISSRSMAQRVADSLDLHRNAEFMGETNPGATEEQLRQRAAGQLASRMDVTVPNDSRIISINYRHESRTLAAQIANSYADNFVEFTVTQGAEANEYARTYLEEQIAELRLRLQDGELEAIGYARNNRIVGNPLAGTGDTSASGTASTLTVANLANINAALTDARGRRIAAEQRWQAIANQPAGQLPEVQQNSSVQSLRSQAGAINAELMQLRERYRDDYPAVIELNARLETVNRQIDAISEEIKLGLRSSFDVARREEAALAAELGRISDQTLDEQDRRVQYNLIDRDVQALRNQLQSLMERYNQLSAAANLRVDSVSKLDNAVIPGAPVSPDLLSNLLVALVLGLGIAGGLALLREIFDDRIRSMDDMERKLGVRGIGQTPWVPDNIAGEIDDEFSPLGEAYSSIRATLDFAMARKRNFILQVTSSEAGEGKTTTSVSIARKYARIGRRVLLVDMDLRRPAVAKIFGHARGDAGLVDVLFSRVELQRALLPTEIENLHVLPVGALPPNPVEILSSGLIPEFLERCREQYDVIILDSSPVIGIADAPLLSRHADGVVFVIEANRAHFGYSRTSIRRIRDMGANIVGGVLTKFKALEAGQDYSYQYRYYTYGSEKT